MWRQGVKFVIVLAVLLLVMLGIRKYAFTVFTVSGNTFAPQMRAGDRYIVNHFDCARFAKGDAVVFTDSTAYYIGTVTAVPGDTITLRGCRYRIPIRCCVHCPCPDCRIYLMMVGRLPVLVHLHQCIGKATRIFRMPVF